MQPVFSRTLLMERTKRAAMGDVKRRRFNSAAGNRGVARSIVLRPRDGHAHLPCPDFQIFVAFDVADSQLARSQAHPKVGALRYFDGGVEVVIGSVRHIHFESRTYQLDLNLHLFQSISPSRAASTNHVFRIATRTTDT